jgi:hypothetical protein
MTNCRICNNETRLHFRAEVLNRHQAEYRYCATCDHVFAADPYWLQEAYTDAIVKTDTDIAVRNVLTALRLAAIISFAFDDRGKGTYVDVAGGYGLLTRLMRDLGFNYLWRDPYATNLFARGFEYSATDGPCSAISAIEVIEHTVNPLDFLQENLAQHGTNTILFSTQLFADGHPPAAHEWDYYSLETGQHIAFFSNRGIRALGERLGLTYHPLGRIHLLTRCDLSQTRLKMASNRVLVLPLALAAARRLGSKRGADRTKMSQLLRAGDKT